MSTSVHNAHLHSIGAAPDDQPTIFDIYSQENLASSIKPALKHIMKVLWPYVHDKLDSFADRWKELLDYRQWTHCSPKDKLKKIFLAIWPWFKSFMVLIKILLNLGYLTSRTTIHSPFLWLAGVRLEKLTAADIESFESIPIHLRQSGILNRFWRFILGLPGVLSRLFAYSLFFFQFIDYLYNSDMGNTILKKNALWTPPPAPHKLLSEAEVLSLDTYKCPLCLKRRVNDTVLSVSGYVFCFNCIDTHVKRYNA
ncbi:hypothetical protein WR25_16430 [Diploscapter pachys]|uniref:Pex N-terminal domain-containing protein n=1 Tax=Diploscapter pachys TaxID=2018661 RepID=A0A2A2JVY5_9BILA|nr:hypothetical protein WR25_16430 [Diploscapter pachys]